MRPFRSWHNKMNNRRIKMFIFIYKLLKISVVDKTMNNFKITINY